MAHKRSGIAEFYSGLGSVALFGALYLITSAELFILIGVFTGVLPMIRGVSKLAQARVARREQKQIAEKTQESSERVVLRLARSQKGRLTPAVIAVNSQLSLDQAEAQLNALVDKGYAQLEVTDDGRLLYVFPEFLPRD